jgi:hypothetical protein
LDSQHHINENDDQEWLAELAELDLGDVHTDTDDDVAQPNSIDAMTRLLTRYVVNGPWIPMVAARSLHEVQVRGIAGDSSKSSVKSSGDPSSSASRTILEKKSLLEFKSLAELLASNASDDKPDDNSVTYVTLNEDIPTASEISDIITDSDRRLGLAGFLPFIMKDRRATWPFTLTLRPRQDEIEDEMVSQWRGHTRFTGHSVRACFLPYTDSLQPSNCQSLADYIGRGIKSLAVQIDVLNQIKGYKSSKLHFIRFTAASGQASLENTECHAEIRQVYVEFVEHLAHAWADTETILIQTLVPGSSWLATIIQRIKTIRVTPKSIVSAKFRVHITDHVGLPPPRPDLTYQFWEYCHRWVGRHQLEHVSVSRLSPLMSLMSALEPILRALGVVEIETEECNQHPSLTLLHLTALALQSLTLIVQFNLRGLTAPCQFEFLASTVSDFVLEGANHSPSARKIYASSQKLSCLGDMLEKEVLVFGLKERDPQQRMDIVATPAQLAELWGPAELVVGNCDPSNPDIASIRAIRIHQGHLIPVGESTLGIQKWHWLADNRADVRLPMDVADMRVDLHTLIQIGARDYPGLNPIGPARLNENCPNRDFRDFIPQDLLSRRLRPLGTRAPVMELQSFTAGVQGGQGAVVTAQGTFAWKPKVTVKAELFGPAVPFNVRIAKLDKMWGLAVSLCTGVMTRVRLRDLVAFYCLRCSPDNIPNIQGQNDREASLNGFAQAMYTHDSLDTWVKSLVPPSNNACYQQGKIERHIIQLFSEVLEMLRDTGIQDNGDLAIACMPQGHSLERLTVYTRKNPWVQVLKDSDLTATFACTLPRCFETDDCRCQKSKWQLPEECQLSTKLDLLIDDRSESDARHRLRIGKSYRINSANLNMTTKIHHRMKSSHGNTVHYATIKKSVLNSALFEYVPKRPRLREIDSTNAVQVIIGGGPQYLGRLEHLQQDSSPKKK